MPTFDGIRVLDLTDGSGVYGTKLLADHGAEVVRLERPGGDPLRLHPPFLGGEPGNDRSLYWHYMNTSKKSVTLDVETDDGRDILARLAAGAAVVAYSGHADRFRRLGLDRLREAHPELVVSAVTPFGLTGPFRDWRGNDAVAWGAGGLTFSTGWPEKPPLTPAPVAELSYILAGYLSSIGILAALRTRRRHGRGQLVDLSVQQAVLTASGEAGASAFIDDSELRTRMGSRRAFTGPMGHFRTTDGFASVLALMPAHWDALAQWIAERTGNDGALDEALRGAANARSGDLRDLANYFTEELAATYTKQELFEEGQRRGVSITPVNDPASAAADPQLAHRGYWRELAIGGERFRSPGPPVRYSTLAWDARPAPRLGEHTAEILGELGLSPTQLGGLAAAGVI